jgi:hypothetical protein
LRNEQSIDKEENNTVLLQEINDISSLLFVQVSINFVWFWIIFTNKNVRSTSNVATTPKFLVD